MSKGLENMLERAAASLGKAAQSKLSQGGAARNAASGGRGKGKKGLFVRMAELYARMEEAYNASAGAASLTCKDCPTNCCSSFFKHHTYVEWAYLWRGLSELAPERRKEFVRRGALYLEEARRAIALGAMPTAMCPLNEAGLCALYPYRLMICRMHGTRNVFVLPEGTRQVFPGCARFTAMHGPVDDQAPPEEQNGPAPLDRTPFYNELAALEGEFRQRSTRPLPRVAMTLAEMLVAGPPRLK